MLMKISKTVLSYLLIVIQILVLAACGSQQGDEPAASTTPPAAATESAKQQPNEVIAKEEETGKTGAQQVPSLYPIYDEPASLTMWWSISSHVQGQLETIANHLGMQQAEAATNVVLDLTEVNISVADEKLSILMAGGDYPDMIKTNVGHYISGLSGAYVNDVIIDLGPYLESCAPDYYAIINATEDNRRAAANDGGEILGFYTVQENLTVTNGPMIQYDLLEELNLSIPSTYDELYDVLKLFKNEYDMSDPFMFEFGTDSNQGSFFSAGYGVISGFYMENGEVIYGPLQDGYYDYIKMLSKWYAEGLINTDFYTRSDNPNDPDVMGIKTSGNAGIFMGNVTNITDFAVSNTTGRDNYRLVAMPDVLMKSGDVSHLGPYPDVISTAGNCITITSKCSDVEVAVKWANFWFTDEGAVITNYGVEGETFEYTDGKAMYTALITDNPEGLTSYLAKMTYLLYLQIPNKYDLKNGEGSYNEDGMAAGDIWMSNMDNNNVLPSSLSFTTDESTTIANIMSDIQTYNQETVLGFILNQSGLTDSAWEQYTNTLVSMSIESVTDIYQDALQRYLSR